MPAPPLDVLAPVTRALLSENVWLLDRLTLKMRNPAAPAWTVSCGCREALRAGPVMLTESVIVGRVDVSVIVCGVLNSDPKLIVSVSPVLAFDWPIAHRRVPTLPSSAVLVTVNVAGTATVNVPRTWAAATDPDV